MKTTIAWCVLAVSMAFASAAGAQEEAIDALERANDLASKGKLAEAVPYYKKSIELDPTGHPLAYLNLAEVQRTRGKCDDAVLMFQLYASLRDTEEAQADAAAGLKKCRADKWPQLTVTSSHIDARVKLNGYLASLDGKFGPAHLPPGDYEVVVEAIDHHPRSEKVSLLDEAATVDLKLEKMTFHGKILVTTNVPGSRVRIFEGTTAKTKELFDLRTPMNGGVEVTEGRHYVEITAKGYDRWIRNVSVARDETATVNVELTRSRPPELDKLKQKTSK